MILQIIMPQLQYDGDYRHSDPDNAELKIIHQLQYGIDHRYSGPEDAELKIIIMPRTPN